MLAAIAAKQQNPKKSVLIIEALSKLGKKILVSGNGRCNILNAGAYQYFGDVAFAHQVLGEDAYQELKQVFQMLGLQIVIESEDRAYPASFQAETVMDVLLLQIKRLQIDLRLNSPVLDIVKNNKEFQMHTKEESFACTKLIAAVGGIASPKHGSNGSLYPVLQRLGLKFYPSKPALCPLLTDTRDIHGLSGIRVRARASLDGRYCSSGEVLFTDYGISGIAAMQLARYCTSGSVIHLDLRPACGLAEQGKDVLVSILSKRIKDYPTEDIPALFSGLFCAKLGRAICLKSGLTKKNMTLMAIRRQDVAHLADTIIRFELSVKGTKGYDFAQVSTGGALCDQFQPATMESSTPGLYCTGEVLNVDGDCGGYNLMFAFKSGLLAGRHAAED